MISGVKVQGGLDFSVGVPTKVAEPDASVFALVALDLTPIVSALALAVQDVETRRVASSRRCSHQARSFGLSSSQHSDCYLLFQ